METCSFKKNTDLVALIVTMLMFLIVGTCIDARRARLHHADSKDMFAEISAKLDSCLAMRAQPAGDDDSADDSKPPTAK